MQKNKLLKFLNPRNLIYLLIIQTLSITVNAQTKEQLYLVGYGKSDITYTAQSIGFFGYGDHTQRVGNKDNGATSQLYSRVVSIKEPESGKQIIYLHADLGGIFLPVRNGLIEKIKTNLYPNFDEASLIMTASHTHCAPSGMSHYASYMMAGPGYFPELVAFIVAKMYESIVQSINNQQLSSIKFKEGIFAPEVPVAYNRALKCYNANPEIKDKFKQSQTNLALNRSMPLLSFTNTKGQNQGLINWFGVHPIEVLADHDFIDGASKGYAAIYAEEKLPQGAVAIFAQSSAGDVMTSDPHNPEMFNKLMQKALHDPTYNLDSTSIKQAQYNGKLQADKALEIQQSQPILAVKGTLDYELIYIDLSKIKVDTEYAHGQKDAQTSSACLGAPFFAGHAFSWKDNDLMRSGLSFISSIGKNNSKLKSIFLSKNERLKIKSYYKSQYPKNIVLNGEKKTILGIKLANYNKKKISTFFLNLLEKQDIILKESIRQLKKGALEEHTLLPQVLPIQIIRIGNIAIAGIPTEITTVAYQRLEATIFEILKNDGVEKVIISSYANEYAGYTTTYEEYQLQRYEGGHTLFGKHQLGAFQTEFKKLAVELLKPKAERLLNRDFKPPVFSSKELELRSNLVPLK